MSDFERYHCQIALPGFGEAAQQKLQRARVLIAGAGGLGCPVAQYLVAAGVGQITIADDDIISTSNLHRQILYGSKDVGKQKATVAAGKLQEQNPDITILALTTRITSENALTLVPAFDLVIDTTDNIETKYLLNDACVLTGIPCVYGAVYQYEGQVSVWNVKNSPNYRDVFPDVQPGVLPACAEGGVIPTLTGVIGCIQANEAIKYLTGIGELLASKLLVIDAATMQTKTINLPSETSTDIKAIQQTVRFISPEELKKGMEQDRFMLIDVRNDDERERFHIGGLHLPLAMIGQFEKNSERPIVCYCASGRRSAEAATIIQQRFPNSSIYSLSGGLANWK